VHVLIDQHRHPSPGMQRLEHAADGALPVNHAVAGTRSHALEQRVEIRIVQGASQHPNRLQLQAVNDRVQFPEPEMTGEKQHPLALRVRQPRPIFTFKFDAAQHLLVRQGTELEHLEQQPPEMREHVTRSGAKLVGRPRRKRPGEIGERDPAPAAIDAVERIANACPHGADGRMRQHTQDGAHDRDCAVLETVHHEPAR
jgi:hypothetical protein